MYYCKTVAYIIIRSSSCPTRCLDCSTAVTISCRNSRNSATSSRVPLLPCTDAVASPTAIALNPNDPGHGPHRQLTQKIAGKTVTQTLSSPLAVRKAEKEIAEFRRFQTLTQELVEVNLKICRWRSLAAEKSTAEESTPGKKKRRKPSSRKSVEK